MSTTVEGLTFQPDNLVIAVANIQQQLEVTPSGISQVYEAVHLLVRHLRGPYWDDLVEGVAEDALWIRSDWARVVEDLRRATSRVAGEIQLEDARG